MKPDGIFFILVISGIIGISHLIFDYADKHYKIMMLQKENEIYREKLGKDIKHERFFGSVLWLNTLYWIYSVRNTWLNNILVRKAVQKIKRVK
jgi:hypothetical protein